MLRSSPNLTKVRVKDFTSSQVVLEQNLAIVFIQKVACNNATSLKNTEERRRFETSQTGITKWTKQV